MYPEKSNTEEEWYYEGEVNGRRSEKFLCERNLNRRLIDRKSELRDSQISQRKVKAEETYLLFPLLLENRHFIK